MKNRAVSSVIAVLLMTAVTVIIAATVTVFVYDISSATQPGPSASFEQELLDEGESDERLELTLTHGDEIRADQVLIVSTEPVDIGGPDTAPNGRFATVGEKLTEGNDQSGVGDYWTAGESILLGGVEDLSGITIRVVWNPVEVRKDGEGGRAPSELIGENSVILWEHTVE